MDQHPGGVIPYSVGHLGIITRLPILLYRLGFRKPMDWLPYLILTTNGEEAPMYTALEYRRHGSKYYVLSFWGERSEWYQNLVANPTTTIQHGRYISSANANVVENRAEALRAVYMFRHRSPIYGKILASLSSAESINFKTLTEVADEFTVIRLDPTEDAPVLPAVAPFRGWLGPALVAGTVMLLLLIVARMIRDEG